MLRLCLRKPHWPLLLVPLALIWILATFFTSAGIYMVICHSQATPEAFTQQKYGDVRCGDSLTLRAGQWMLISGCLCNGMLLAVMIMFLVMERRQRPVNILQQEEPPAYEMVIKEETPPPSFSELGLVSSSTSLTSLTPSLKDWIPLPRLSLSTDGTTV